MVYTMAVFVIRMELVVKLPESLANDLADGGMGENDLPGVGDTHLHLNHFRCAPDDLTGVGADEVDT